MARQEFSLVRVRLTGIGLMVACVVVSAIGYQIGKDWMAALLFGAGSYLMAGAFVIECCVDNEEVERFSVLWRTLGWRTVLLLVLWFPVLMSERVRDVVVGVKPGNDDA